MNESMWDKIWDAALFAKWDKTGDMLMGQNRVKNQRNHGIKGGICLWDKTWEIRITYFV